MTTARQVSDSSGPTAPGPFSCEVRSLRLNGYDVTSVESGETALRHLERETFDVIVLDLNLPGISGIDVLVELSCQKKAVHRLECTPDSRVRVCDPAACADR